MATPKTDKSIPRVARPPKRKPSKYVPSPARVEMMKTFAEPFPTIYKVGRPTLYDPEFCDVVIRMGAEGCSVVEMCGYLGVSRNTLETEWPDKHPEFSQALHTARLLCQSWWERTGRQGAVTGELNPAIWTKNMTARFRKDWIDTSRTEHTGADGGPVVVEDRAKSLVERILANAGKLGGKDAE